eukprot:CAMPEP_0174754400 /NCGR_PEP_ID=MMETSP1094-20130205/105717_1 /TAXON_ID=156173 /ORGANISM="Chrysochromulina brevifilum, Strain UTEX LB 985" /LENGTH=924 /DNA_ID=CAMNT_0015960265 /DNA_START=87 /DNA_END=2861 /DNA_ORIENTATION=-
MSDVDPHLKDVKTLLNLGLTVQQIRDLWEGMPGVTLDSVMAEAEKIFMESGTSKPAVCRGEPAVRRGASLGITLLKDLPPTEERLRQLLSKVNEDLESPPTKFQCPVSLELMSDPVLISSGHIFDRKSLYDDNGSFRFNRCPFTRQTLEYLVAFPVVSLKSEIVEYKMKRLDGVLEVVDRVVQMIGTQPSFRELCDELLSVASTVLESLGASVYHHRAARVYRNKLIVCAGDAEARLGVVQELAKYTSRDESDELAQIFAAEAARARATVMERWATSPASAAKFAVLLITTLGERGGALQTTEWVALLHELRSQEVRQAAAGAVEGRAAASAAPFESEAPLPDAVAPPTVVDAPGAVVVTLEAANHYGFSAPPVPERQDQLTNSRRMGAHEQFELRVLAEGELTLESAAHRGYFVAAAGGERVERMYGMQVYRVVLMRADESSGAPPRLRQVAARNGDDEPWFSIEPLEAPGYRLCHCDGRLWFFDRPANSERIFAQDATWRLHDIGRDTTISVPRATMVSSTPRSPMESILSALPPPSEARPAIAYWQLVLQASTPTTGLWRRAYVALVAAGAVQPAAAIDAFIAKADGSGSWLESAGGMLMDLAGLNRRAELPPFVADAPAYLRPPTFGPERNALVSYLADATLRIAKEKGHGALSVSGALGGVLGSKHAAGESADGLRAFLVSEGVSNQMAAEIVSALPVLPRSTEAAVSVPPAWLARLVGVSAAPEAMDFNVDVTSEEELSQSFPQIHTTEPDTLSVRDGMLIKRASRRQNSQLGDELNAGVPREYGATSVTYEINITCGRGRYNVGLGCYVGDGLQVRFVFHPGMGGGQFRLESSNGNVSSFNRNIGFTPPDWDGLQSNERGQRGTKFSIRLSVEGRHSVTLTHPTDPSLTFTAEFEDAELWTREMGVKGSWISILEPT